MMCFNLDQNAEFAKSNLHEVTRATRVAIKQTPMHLPKTATSKTAAITALFLKTYFFQISF